MREKTPNNYVEGLPRVSDIVDYFYPFPRDAIPKEKLDFAINRGKAVHRCLELKVQDNNFMLRQESAKLLDIPKATDMYLEGVEFLKKLQGSFNYPEPEGYHKNEHYQGTIDLVLQNRNTSDYIILDWKTGTQMKESNLFQLWLYRKLFDRAVEDMLLVYLYHGLIVSYEKQNKKYNLDKKFSEMYDLWLKQKNF